MSKIRKWKRDKNHDSKGLYDDDDDVYKVSELV